MATERKSPPIPSDYTEATGKCAVYTIELVIPINNASEALQHTLNAGRAYGACGVIKKRCIAEDFDTATNIFDKRCI